MEIWIRRESEEWGPYTLDQVKEYIDTGEVTLEDKAWVDGWDDYLTVGDIQGVGAKGMEIWIRRDGDEFGPYPLAEVKEYVDNGGVALEDEAWFDGCDDYVTVGDIPNITSMVDFSNPAKSNERAIALSIVGILIATGTTALTAIGLGINTSLTLLITVGSLVLFVFIIHSIQIHLIRNRLKNKCNGIPRSIIKLWSLDGLNKHSGSDLFISGSVSAINIHQSLLHLSRIDKDVITAIDKINDPRNLNSFNNIVNHLSEKKGIGTASWQGSVNTYKGELGEQWIKEQLEANGHHVVMAEQGQKGWDAIVDGERYNFKVGLNASKITDHLNNFEDIPVITVSEHAGFAANHPDVFALEAVSGTEILECTENAMNSSVELAGTDLDIFDLKLPVVTLVLSAGKNFTPILSGNSDDIGSALKFTAADTVGVGAGGAVGAKLGGIAGSFLGPVGAAFGAIVGGVAGAMGGRDLAKGFKEKELKEAQAALEKYIHDYGKGILNGLHKKSLHLKSTSAKLKASFSLLRFISPTTGDIIKKDMRKSYINWAKSCMRTADSIKRDHTKNETREIDYKSVGLKFLSKPIKEPIYCPIIMKSLEGVRDSSVRIKNEKLKLGYE